MTDVKPARREKAEATRRRILAAAHEEFAEKGYHGATMATIAARAGVAGQTVYFVFHTKAALISALIDQLVTGVDHPHIPQDSAWWAAMRSTPDAAEALRHFIRGAAPLFARASAISEVLRAAALTDADVHETYQSHELRRETGFREVVEVIASKHPLRPELNIDTATDVLLTIFGDSTYYMMTTDRGWTHDRFFDWACEAVPLLLLAP